MRAVVAMDFVDRTRVVIGGQSRGRGEFHELPAEAGGHSYLKRRGLPTEKP